MTERMIDIDDTLIEEVGAYLGTTTLSDTVNAALREIRRRKSVAEELAWWRTDPLPHLRDPEFIRKMRKLPD